MARFGHTRGRERKRMHQAWQVQSQSRSLQHRGLRGAPEVLADAQMHTLWPRPPWSAPHKGERKARMQTNTRKQWVVGSVMTLGIAVGICTYGAMPSTADTL